MNQIRKVEEYKSPDMRFFKMQTRQRLCNSSFSNVEPRYDGFGEEEEL